MLSWRIGYGGPGIAVRWGYHTIYSFPPFMPGDPLHDSGFRDLAVDEECLYYVRRLNGGSDKWSIVAHSKQ